MPSTDLDLVELLRSLNPNETVIEKVGQWVGPNVARNSMFTFGWVAAGPHWVLRTLGLPVRYIPPQIWQRALNLDAKSEHGKRWKAYLADEARKLYPNLKVTLYTADALLILTAALRGLV